MSRFRIPLILAALTALLIGYYWINKPFDLTVAQALVGIILDLIPISLLAGCAGSIGHWLFVRFALNLDVYAERVTVETLFGLGIIATYALVVGLLGGFKPLILWLPLLVVGGATLIDTRGAWLRDCFALFIRALHPTGSWAWFLTCAAMFLLGTGLLVALTPPIAWDTLAYHLVGPARYLTAGRIGVQPDNLYLGLPQGVEMLYGLALSLFGRDTASATIHWLFGLLALTGTAGIVLRHTGSDSSAQLAVLILLSAFSIWEELGSAYNDLAMMAYGVAIPIILIQWRQTRHVRWLVLLGLLLGLALGIKLTAGALVVSAGLYVLIYTIRINLRLTLRSELIIAGTALLAFSPWLVKGAWLYHNPIYPYLFGGLNWNATRAALFSGQGLLSIGQGWLWLFLPFSATIYGAPFISSFRFSTGPWLLTLPFLLVFSWRSIRNMPPARQLMSSAILFGLPLLIYWWIAAGSTEIGIQTRLMSIGLPICAVLGSLAVEALRLLPKKPINVSFIFKALFVLSIGFEMLQVTQLIVQDQVVPYLMGVISRDDFLNSFYDPYYVAMIHLRTLPRGALVRFMWEPHGYYCPPSVNCIADPMLDNWPVGLLTDTPDALLASWKQQGDGYFLVYNSALDYYRNKRETAQASAQFMDAKDRWLTPIWSNGDYTLYTWKTF